MLTTNNIEKIIEFILYLYTEVINHKLINKCHQPRKPKLVVPEKEYLTCSTVKGFIFQTC